MDTLTLIYEVKECYHHILSNLSSTRFDWLGWHHMRTSKPPEINKQATLLETSSHRLGRHSQLMHVTYKSPDQQLTTRTMDIQHPTSKGSMPQIEAWCAGGFQGHLGQLQIIFLRTCNTNGLTKKASCRSLAEIIEVQYFSKTACSPPKKWCINASFFLLYILNTQHTAYMISTIIKYLHTVEHTLMWFHVPRSEASVLVFFEKK